MSETKVCKSCGRALPLIKNFSTNGKTRAGNIAYRSSCKLCESKRLKVIRKNNSEYNIREKERRKKRLRHIDSETFSAKCAVCGKNFIFLSHPEKPFRVSVICKKCSKLNRGE